MIDCVALANSHEYYIAQTAGSYYMNARTVLCFGCILIGDHDDWTLYQEEKVNIGALALAVHV